MDATATYSAGQARHAREVAALERRARTIGTARLALFVASLGLLVGIVWVHLGTPGYVTLAGTVLAFVALVMMHTRVHEARDRSAAALRFHERGLHRLAHAWDKLPVASARFRDADHPFVNDLDVFGRGSVMQMVDATETLFGEEHLAKLLSLQDAGAWPADVAERQAAVRELAGRTAMREALATAGGVLADERPDPAPLLAWAEGKEVVPGAIAALGWAMPAALAAVVLGGPALGAPPWAGWVAAAVAIVVGGWAGARLSPMLAAASARERAISRWQAMLAILEGEPLQAPLLARLKARLSTAGAAVGDGAAPAAGAAADGARHGKRASVEIAALERIVGWVDARQNEVFRLLIGPLVMWDVHCAAALVRWRGRAGGHVREWLDALGEMEALASLAGFAFEHPEFAWPELAAEPVIEARGLGHPLVAADRRVDNDVSLPAAGRALVVTGSNMSGKSTLLRALGVNTALAMAGAPVCAKAARIGPARVATSMRIEDSLEQGVSHFYAELRRLKRVIDLAREPGRAPVLFLLDEILHGTNSRERVLGACAVVRELLARGALGAVSTHDLGITALGEELGGRVQNVHFEEQVAAEQMTFDYVLRPGIVQSSNALRLMRAVGIDVVDVA